MGRHRQTLAYSGLATGQEYRDFRQAGLSTTALTQEFLNASQRARRLWGGVGLLAILLLGLVTWLWQKGYNVEQAMLKVQSMVVSIHLEPEMVEIPGGKFNQGSEFDPIENVKINPFSLSQHEVTFEEYDRFAIDSSREFPNDQGWGRGKRPVMNVTWDDAKGLCGVALRANRETPIALPTESEWEYAARSGAKQEKFAGTSEEAQLPEYAVYAGNSGNRTAEVGSKQKNTFGLQDMSGNVWEWVEDCWHESYEGAPEAGRAWLEEEQGDCSRRVVRGGSWDERNRWSLRASTRNWGHHRRPGRRSSDSVSLRAPGSLPFGLFPFTLFSSPLLVDTPRWGVYNGGSMFLGHATTPKRRRVTDTSLQRAVLVV